jgi:hypothetical protein
MIDKEAGCPCPNKDCPRHGDCAACFAEHTRQQAAAFCMRPENARLISDQWLLDRVRDRLQAAALADSILDEMERT